MVSSLQNQELMAPLIILVLLLALLPLLHLLTRRPKPSHGKLPPGSLGIPFIGQSLGFLRAMWANRAEEWLAGRIDRYGPISKLTLFGSPTVFLTGPLANKFIFTHEAVAAQQPKSVVRILGRRNLLELNREDHRRVRGGVAQFLKADLLKKYVGIMEAEVKYHLEKDWVGHLKVKVLPLMKSLTFNMTCTLLFGIGRGPLQDDLWKDFMAIMDGMWALPVNLPFTNFNKSLKASKHARKFLTKILNERKAAAVHGKLSSTDDLISHLVGMDFSEEEIVDNAVFVMVAGYDTTSILITFIIRQLAKDPKTRALVRQEQDEIAKSKDPGDPLTWDHISKMKYTWRVAMETLRTIPIAFGSFRKALKDLEFNGYVIPKGWQIFWAANITHMDPEIFAEPEKFDPDRFESLKPLQPYSFVGFGGGLHLCPGNEFARIETLTMLHHLVTRFEWKLCCEEDSFRRDPMPSPREGLPIELQPRIN